VKILDFGLARPMEGDVHLTQTGVVAGTPQYMAPEQAAGATVDHRCDLFGLGCILYRMVTGRLPFEGANALAILQALAVHEPKLPRALNPEVPGGLSELIMWLLAKDPNDRPQTARAVIDALDAIEHARVTINVPQRRQRWPQVMASVGVLVLGIIGWFYGAAVYRFATNQGQLIIETDDPDVEVIVKRNGEQVQLVDRKTGHEVTLRAGRYTLELSKGKEGLKLSTTEFTLDRGGKEIARVRFEPIAVTPEKTADQPFVVLTVGRSERNYASFAAAVNTAASGDVIEIRGNGPFVTPTVNLGNKALAIRAAPGFRPVLSLAPEAVRADASVLKGFGPLVLEGLEFHCPEVRREPQPRQYVSLISNDGPLHVANCRFLVRECGFDVVGLLNTAGSCDVRNCQFVGAMQNYLIWWCRPGRRLSLHNCVALTRGGLTFSDLRGGLNDVSLDISNNTLVSARSVHHYVNDAAKGRPEEPALAAFNMHVSGNVFDSYGDAAYGFSLDNERRPRTAKEMQAAYRKSVVWHEQGNVYAEGKGLFIVGSKSVKLTVTLTDLAQWQEFWEVKETGSRQGRIRYKGGDLGGKLAGAPDTITPDDFRLEAGSAGFRAGPGGRDIGADVDLVGPGPAYERWKATPAYQQWLKDATLARAAQAFVVLGQDGKAERKYASLAEAIAGAAANDTVELRDNGPFVLPPLDLKQKPLTVRAADGYRPVLTLAADAVEADLPFLSTQAALTLEGLEFQREGGSKRSVGLKHIYALGAPLAVANCRFVLRTKADILIDAVRAERSPSCRVLNCEFLGDWHAGAGLNWAGPGQRLVARNCLFLTKHAGLHVSIMDDAPIVPAAVLQVSNNTMVVGNHAVNAQATLEKGPAPAPPQPKVRIEARHNVCTGGLTNFVFFSFSREADDFLEREHRARARQLFALEEQGNVLRAGPPLAGFGIIPSGGKGRPVEAITTPAAWADFWKVKKMDSRLGKLSFAAKLAPGMAAPEQRSPQDFRALVDGAAVTGTGADLDMVGPGAAYSRFRGTPEYLQWLKDTNQVK
jgi:hypothetical protein